MIHIAIFPPHQQFLQFAVGKQHFQFVALVPWLVLTKVLASKLAVLCCQGIHIIRNLDDLLLKDHSVPALAVNV